LPLSDQRALELCERTHHRQQQRGHGGVVTGEDELLLHELHLHAAGGQTADDGAQVVEVAREPVHRMHDDGVAVADELQHRLELGPV